MSISGKIFATTCAGALTIFLAMPVCSSMAQESAAPDSSASAAAPMQNSSVDDATLQKAARAYVQVKKINHDEKASGDTSPNKVAQAEADKLQAVRSQGLQPEQYDQVIQMVQNDSGLQQKFLGYVNQNGGDTN
jgi:hypothetical protein